MNDPIAIAKYYRELKKTLTVNEICELVEKSPSHVSRYLSLLSLPLDAQADVSAGIIPARNAIKVWRSRSLPKSKAAILPKLISQILNLIGEKIVVTVSQMARFTGRSMDSVRRSIPELLARNLVEVHKEVRPHVYRLSSGGAARLGKSFQRRWISASAMHQYLMRNEVEIKYRKEGVYKYFDRVELFKLGFHPSVAEHVLETVKDDETRRSLILIDDYNMPLRKIGQRLARIHHPMSRYYSGAQRQWLHIVDQVVIFVCDADRVKLHKSAIRDELSNIENYAKSSSRDVAAVRETKREMMRNSVQILDHLKSITVSYLPPVLEVR